MSTNSNRTIELAYMGDEPDFSKLVLDAEDYESQYSHALNYAWHLFRYDHNGARDEFMRWAEKNSVQSDFPGAEDYHFSTIGQIAWIANSGGQISEKTREWVLGHVAGINEKLQTQDIFAPAIPIRKLSKEEILARHRNEIFSEIDEAVFDGTYLDHQNLATELLKRCSFGKGDAEVLRQRFMEQLTEIKLFGTNDDVTEGYSHMSNKEREDYTQRLVAVLSDFDSYVQNRTAGQTKSRLKRRARTSVGHAAKRALRDVEDVQYKRSDTDLNIDSIDPTAIVGASAALIYNTKKRKISLFIAEPGGLTISGTTIKSFDTHKSVMKAVRKPEDILPHFRKGTLKRAQVMIETNIKGKLHTDISGRLNSDTLLLKAFK